jgi:hypothetical protein
MYVMSKCKQCSGEFQVLAKEIKRGGGKYCSRSCAAQARSEREQAAMLAIQKVVGCSLPECTKEFAIDKSRETGSKSGLFFCCREHKDLAQRIGGVSKIQPDHYGTSTSIYSYRRIAFENYPHRCDVCGWCEIPEVLVVHHRDHDRNNNQSENLQILCPTHHMVHHWQTKSGPYSS